MACPGNNSFEPRWSRVQNHELGGVRFLARVGVDMFLRACQTRHEIAMLVESPLESGHLCSTI